MSRHDENLIYTAMNIPYVEHDSINMLIVQAESQECKDKLRAIQRKKELFEEYKSGNL